MTFNVIAYMPLLECLYKLQKLCLLLIMRSYTDCTADNTKHKKQTYKIHNCTASSSNNYTDHDIIHVQYAATGVHVLLQISLLHT